MEKLTLARMCEIYDNCKVNNCDNCPLALAMDIDGNSACSLIGLLQEAMETYNDFIINILTNS